MTSHTMQLSYLVLLGTTLIFLLMIIPCNNPCGGAASVANQETVEVNLFLSRVFCGSSRVATQEISFALPLAQHDCRQVIFSLSGGTSCL